MAILEHPISSDDWEDLTDNLYNVGSVLKLNYDGTLVFSENIDVPLYDFEIQIGNPYSTDKFINECSLNGLYVKSHPTSYVTVWYDGADSTQSMMTLEEYIERTTNV
jgi:hypothetical protein